MAQEDTETEAQASTTCDTSDPAWWETQAQRAEQRAIKAKEHYIKLRQLAVDLMEDGAAFNSLTWAAGRALYEEAKHLNDAQEWRHQGLNVRQTARITELAQSFEQGGTA